LKIAAISTESFEEKKAKILSQIFGFNLENWFDVKIGTVSLIKYWSLNFI